MPNENSFHGPHLSAAFLCERVLSEKDNVPSFIRVVERFMIPILPAKLPPGVQVQITPPVLQTMLVIAIKAGTLGGGKYTVKIVLQKPDGTHMPENTLPAFFNGSDDNGVLLGVPIVLPSPMEGLYWFDVYFEEALLTRVPMRILHQEIAIPFQQGRQQ